MSLLFSEERMNDDDLVVLTFLCRCKESTITRRRRTSIHRFPSHLLSVMVVVVVAVEVNLCRER